MYIFAINKGNTNRITYQKNTELIAAFRQDYSYYATYVGTGCVTDVWVTFTVAVHRPGPQVAVKTKLYT